jgi:signal transduction histidine kinase
MNSLSSYHPTYQHLTYQFVRRGAARRLAVQFFCVVIAVLVSFLLLPPCSRGQAEKTRYTAAIDSLKAVLQALPNDTTKVNTLNELAWTYREDSQLYVGFSMASTALNLAEQLAFTHGIAVACRILGAINRDIDNYPASSSYLFRALSLFQRMGDDYYEALVFKDIGSLYMVQHRINEALGFHFRALEIAKQVGKKELLLKVHYSIGIAYIDQKQVGLAMEHLRAAQSCLESPNDRNRMRITSAIASVYLLLNDLPRAEQTYMRALALVNQWNLPADKAHVYSNLAHIRYKQKDYANAMKYAIISNELASTMQLVELVSNTNSFLATIFREQGDYKKSLEYMERATSIKDSILNEQSARQVNELRAKYEYAAQQQQIALLKAQESAQTTLRNLLLVVSILLMLVVIVIISRYRAQKREAERTKQLTMLNATIAGQEAERKRIALELHDSLGQILSLAKLNLTSAIEETDAHQTSYPAHYTHTLQRSVEAIDRAVQEVRMIAHDLSPVALQDMGLQAALRELFRLIPDSIHAQLFYDVHTSFDEHTTITLYRIAQETIQNAVKHSHCTELSMDIVEFDDSITLTAFDNGIGFDVQHVTALEDSQRGMGLNNIQTRARSIGADARIESTPEHGTTISITLLKNIPITSAEHLRDETIIPATAPEDAPTDTPDSVSGSVSGSVSERMPERTPEAIVATNHREHHVNIATHLHS